jgi:hypothetical protein
VLLSEAKTLPSQRTEEEFARCGSRCNVNGFASLSGGRLGRALGVAGFDSSLQRRALTGVNAEARRSGLTTAWSGRGLDKVPKANRRQRAAHAGC